MTQAEEPRTHKVEESISLLQEAAKTDHPVDAAVVLDFGSQYSQLITRRIREIGVYGELIAHDSTWEEVEKLNPKAVILSGGPASVYADGAPQMPDWVLEHNLPTLGICYGMQLIAHAMGGKVEPSEQKEFGPASLNIEPIANAERLFEGLPATQNVWMSHGDHISALPEGFDVLAWSTNSPIAAMGNDHIVGIQFHPEVNHTEYGTDILRNFLVNIAGCETNWSAESFIDASIRDIREKVGDGRVLLGLSGGVDSSVAAALIHKAIGDQLTPVFVNNGLLREGEAESVQETFTKHFETNLVYADASERFLENLKGVSDPEQKRKIIGETFVRVFESEANKAGPFEFLAQGTLYSDVIESATGKAGDSKTAVKIKTHHNVGGLPDDMDFKLLEPFRLLFKDEVREVGRLLGVPEEIVERQPFPGPGLAVRLLGEITEPDLAILRKADKIVREEIEAAEGERPWQFFAVLLPVQSTGVMGDYRTYAKTCAVRAISSQDAMTADWSRLPYDVLARISNRVVNEVDGINRVVYDITSKPPATIEWE